MTDDRVSESAKREILLDLLLEREPEKELSAAERRVRDELARDVERIRAAGGIVEIPFDLP